MDKTGIQWTDATWNPIRGCSRVSEGCRNCYAEGVAARFSGPGLPYEGLARRRSNGEPQWTGEVRVIESAMLQPLRWRKPRRVFVNSMSDLFHERVTDETLDRIFAVMATTPRHTFQILTKRPERMRAYFESACRSATRAEDVCEWAAEMGLLVGWDTTPIKGIPFGLPNVHLGVSCENQPAADERIPLLLDTPAAVRFVSAEPLLGPLDLSQYLDEQGYESNGPAGWVTTGCGIDWVIAGGESGSSARPCDVSWVRSILGECKAAGVPVFVKQLGAYVVEREVFKPIPGGNRMPMWGGGRSIADGTGWRRILRDPKGGDMGEWPEDLRVREFPDGGRS